MDLTPEEATIIDALSHYVTNGQLEPQVTVGEVIDQTDLCADEVNGALSRLMGRGWISCGPRYRWTADHFVILTGEGLSRCASAASRRALTLFEVRVGEICFYVSYDEPVRAQGQRLWTARAHRADSPGSPPEEVATGITRVKARDALVRKLGFAMAQSAPPVVRCDIE
jgi:hypothetical protein